MLTWAEHIRMVQERGGTSPMVLDTSLGHHCLGMICSTKIISKALSLGKYVISETLKQKSWL